MKKLSFFAFALALFATGCKKESGTNGSNCTLSSTSLPGVYKITAVTYQADAQSPIEDDFVNYEECEKDDLLTIKTNGTLTLTEGAKSCTPPNDPITINWVLNGSNIVLTDGTFEQSYPIINFTCNSFKIKDVDPDNGSITITTYARQ